MASSPEFMASEPLPFAALGAVGAVETSLPPFETFDQDCRAVLSRLRADTGLALGGQRHARHRLAHRDRNLAQAYRAADLAMLQAKHDKR